MAESARTRLPRVRARDRQREIRRCLADLGFSPGRLRIWRGSKVAASAEPDGLWLRTALERLGPVFTAFGAYLASRVDVLPMRLRVALAPLGSRGTAAPVAVVRELIARELDRSPAAVFGGFEDEPFDVGLLYQAHRAWLVDGSPVVVKVAPSWRDDAVAVDLALLGLLKGVLVDGEGKELPLRGAIADFRHTVRQQIDFAHEAKALEALAGDAEVFEGLGAPNVYRDLSTARLLTRERLPGWSLPDVLDGCRGGPEAQPSFAGLDRTDLASRLCTAWLRQVMLGRFLPAVTWPADVWILPDGRVSFGGVFSSLPAAVRKDLWEYLLAVAANDPDAACGHLFRVLEKDTRTVHEDDLRHRLRQAAPYRDAGRGRSDSLGELLLAHWRLAQTASCRPPLYLTRFFRAVLFLDEAARRLAPSRYALRDGLENVRVVAAVGQLREMLSFGSLSQSLTQYVPLLPELPRRLDEVLTLMAAGSARMRLQVRESAEKRERQNATAVTVALLLVLVATAFLARHLAALDALGEWGGKLAVAAFVLAGGWLLLRVGDTR